MLAVVRHGDRTPKQKMKMKITQVCTDIDSGETVRLTFAQCFALSLQTTIRRELLFLSVKCVECSCISCSPSMEQLPSNHKFSLNQLKTQYMQVVIHISVQDS